MTDAARVGLAVVLATVLLVTGCAGSPGRTNDEAPDPQPGARTAGGRRVHSPDRYVRAEGSGESEAEARNMALAELSRFFESRIVSETRDHVVAKYSESSEKSRSRMEQDIQSTVVVTTAAALNGVDTSEVWFDESDRLFHATAVLDKSLMAANWLSRIRELDARISLNLEPGAGGTRYSRYRRYREGAALWTERTVYAVRLRVIGSEAPEPVYELSEVLRREEEERAGLVVALEVGGIDPDVLERVLRSALTQEGIAVTDTQSAAHVLLRAGASTQELQLDNPGWRFSRAEASGELLDLESAQVVGAASRRARASNPDYGVAEEKSVRRAADLLAAAVVEWFR